MAHWWQEIQWRMIQTNLREIDMENISAADYVDQLKELHADVVTLNAAGIIASYDTKLSCQTKSSFLHGASLKEIVDECHQAGIRVIARTDFSKIRYELYEQHPDWAYRTASGELMNYNNDVQTCPNGEYQKKYMFDILQEVLTEIPFDGVFLNMSGFLVVDYSEKYYGPCHCENCQREFRRLYQMDLPVKDDPRDPAYLRYMGFKAKVMAEQKQHLYQLIKNINPEIAVNGFDYLRTESNTEIGQEKWPYSASMNARISSGWDRKKVSDNASVDFMGFRYRDCSVSSSLLKLRLWQDLSNSGCISYYMMGMPSNHLDASGRDGIQKIFAFAEKHADTYQGLQSKAEVLLLHGAMLQRNDHEAEGWIRALTEMHVPFDEVSLKNSDALHSFDHWKIVILPNIALLKEEQRAALDLFAEQGGTVIADGETSMIDSHFQPCSSPMLKSLGIVKTMARNRSAMSAVYQFKAEEETTFTHSYPAHYIAPGPEVIENEYASSARQYMQMVPEHPFGPPERCYSTEVKNQAGVIVNSYGRGKGIYIPWLAGTFYRTEGYQNTFDFMKDVVLNLAGAESLSDDMTSMVETVLTEKENMTVLHLINYTGIFMNSFVEPVELHDLKIRLPKCAGTVTALNGGEVKAEYQGDDLILTLNVLKEYEAVIIAKEEN